MHFLQFNPIKDKLRKSACNSSPYCYKTQIFQKKVQKILKKDEHIKFTIEYIDIMKIYTTGNFT